MGRASGESRQLSFTAQDWAYCPVSVGKPHYFLQGRLPGNLRCCINDASHICHKNTEICPSYLHTCNEGHIHTQMMKTNWALSLGLGVNINFLSVAYGRDLLLLGLETDKSLILIGRKIRRCDSKRSLLSYYIGGDYTAVHLYLSSRLCLQHGMAKWLVQPGRKSQMRTAPVGCYIAGCAHAKQSREKSKRVFLVF